MLCMAITAGTARPPFELAFERHLKSGELVDACEGTKGTGPVPDHVGMPVGTPALVCGGKACQHIGNNLAAFNSFGGIAARAHNAVTAGGSRNEAGISPAVAGAGSDGPLSARQHQFGYVQEYKALNRAAVHHSVKFAITQKAKPFRGRDANPVAHEMTCVIAGGTNPAVASKGSRHDDIIAPVKAVE